MGFMAGFGPAFSRSFEGARDRAHAERQDTFRLVYQDLIQKREKRDAEIKEDRKAVAKAKALAASVPGVPEEAWMKAYEWVKSDLSDSQIMENLQTGSFEIAQSAASPDTPTAPSSVDTQMTASGIAPAAEQTAPVQPASAPRGEVDTGNPITNFLKKKAGTSGDLRREKAIERIAKETGASVDDIRAELDGTPSADVSVDPTRVKYTPGALSNKPDEFNTGEEASIELAQAKTAYDQNPTPQNEHRLMKAQERLQAIIAWTDTQEAIKAKRNGTMPNGVLHKIYGPNGYETSALIQQDEQGSYRIDERGKKTYLAEDQTAEPVSEQELKDIDAIMSDMKVPTQELAARKASVESAIQTVARMNDAVEKSQGKILAAGPSGALAWIQKMAFQLGVAGDEIQQTIAGADAAASNFASGQPIDQGMVNQELQKLKGLHDTLLSKDQNDLAVQKGLYDTQKAIFTYQLASAMGQDGKSLAEPERKLFSQLAASGTSPDKFRESMAAILGNMVDSVDAQGRAIGDGTQRLNLFREQYGYIPKGVEITGMAESLDQNEDPTVQQVWGWVRPKGSVKQPTQAQPQPQTPVENIPMISSPAEAAKLPSGTKFKSPDGKIRIVP